MKLCVGVAICYRIAYNLHAFGVIPSRRFVPMGIKEQATSKSSQLSNAISLHKLLAFKKSQPEIAIRIQKAIRIEKQSVFKSKQQARAIRLQKVNLLKFNL